MILPTRVLKSKKLEITQIYKPGVHNGIDIVGANYTLDDIIAHSDGKVIAVRRNATGFESGGSYGNYVKIDHGNGYYTLYAHMIYNSPTVNIGDYVKKGQVIGSMGNTGTSYGAHVHFEVWKNGKKIDPTKYLNEDLYENKPAPSKTIDELVKEVKNGDWGNQPERQQRLEAAGYNYEEVRRAVNASYNKPNNELKVGDKVQIIATGNGNTYGTANVAYGVGWTREILKIYDGNPFPYQIGNNTGTTGFYSKSALKKI